MNRLQTCGACGMAIQTCPDCNGLICSDGCPDRAEDGCICALEENDDDIA